MSNIDPDVQAQHTLNAVELGKINDIRIAMLTMMEADGAFHSRPIATHEVEASSV